LEREVDSDVSVYRGVLDLRTSSKLMLLITGFIQYGNWLFMDRAGHNPPKPDLIAKLAVGPTD